MRKCLGLPNQQFSVDRFNTILTVLHGIVAKLVSGLLSSPNVMLITITVQLCVIVPIHIKLHQIVWENDSFFVIVDNQSFLRLLSPFYTVFFKHEINHWWQCVITFFLILFHHVFFIFFNLSVILLMSFVHELQI